MSEVTEHSIKIQSWIKRLLEDPLTEILLNTSLLSKIQLETLLIDLLSEEITGNRINYEGKAKLRLNDKGISRGSFNRTLKQANININKSINTVLLLGYLGIFKTPQLQPFIEISNNLNRYIKSYRSLWNIQNRESIENIAIIGSRKFNDYILLKFCLDAIKPGKIISGGASGTDKLAEQYANEKNLYWNIIFICILFCKLIGS